MGLVQIWAYGLWKILLIDKKKWDKIMKYVAFCGKWNRDYAAHLTNAINFLLAWIHKIQF
jgi:hypothetical protein